MKETCGVTIGSVRDAAHLDKSDVIQTRCPVPLHFLPRQRTARRWPPGVPLPDPNQRYLRRRSRSRQEHLNENAVDSASRMNSLRMPGLASYRGNGLRVEALLVIVFERSGPQNNVTNLKAHRSTHRRLLHRPAVQGRRSDQSDTVLECRIAPCRYLPRRSACRARAATRSPVSPSGHLRDG